MADVQCAWCPRLLTVLFYYMFYVASSGHTALLGTLCLFSSAEALFALQSKHCCCWLLGCAFLCSPVACMMTVCNCRQQETVSCCSSRDTTLYSTAQWLKPSQMPLNEHNRSETGDGVPFFIFDTYTIQIQPQSCCITYLLTYLHV